MLGLFDAFYMCINEFCVMSDLYIVTYGVSYLALVFIIILSNRNDNKLLLFMIVNLRLRDK